MSSILLFDPRVCLCVMWCVLNPLTFRLHVCGLCQMPCSWRETPLWPLIFLSGVQTAADYSCAAWKCVCVCVCVQTRISSLFTSLQLHKQHGRSPALCLFTVHETEYAAPPPPSTGPIYTHFTNSSPPSIHLKAPIVLVDRISLKSKDQHLALAVVC